MQITQLILLLSHILCLCQGLFVGRRKLLPPPLADVTTILAPTTQAPTTQAPTQAPTIRTSTGNPEVEFDDYLKQTCFTALKGAAMDGQSKFMLTPAENATDCVDLCMRHGQTKKPPVCAFAANFFARKTENTQDSEVFDFMKPGACECFYTVSYAAYSKKKSAIWFKRNQNGTCTQDPKCALVLATTEVVPTAVAPVIDGARMPGPPAPAPAGKNDKGPQG